MSGGALEYVSGEIGCALDELESWTVAPNPDAPMTRGEWPEARDEVERRRRQVAAEPEVRGALIAALPLLRAAQEALHDVEWWLSGDYGPERAVAALRAVVASRGEETP